MNIYEIKVKDNKDKIVELKKYKNKILLIVNTATSCGFTPQYKGLQSLYEKYNDKGLEILDFPCNQFGNQAKGTNEEIATFCEINYQTTFKQFKKIEVNGVSEDPLYTFLKNEKGGLLNKDIKWNFTKFLVDKKGNVIKRYSPTTTPEKIEQDIIKLL